MSSLSSHDTSDPGDGAMLTRCDGQYTELRVRVQALKAAPGEPLHKWVYHGN